MSVDAEERAGRGPEPRDDESADADGRPGAPADPSPTAGNAAGGAAAADGFGARGWVLVGVVVLSTVVVPGLIYAFPALPSDAGLPFLAAMLVLPMLPAVLLGVAAVWSMSAATGSADDRE